MMCRHNAVVITFRRGPKKTPARSHVFAHESCRHCGLWLCVRWVSDPKLVRVYGNSPANAETIRGAANAAGRAEVLTTPREFPALTPRSTEGLT